MTLEEFQQFIDEQDSFFRSLRDMSQSEREHLFSRMIKLGEEYGELCDAVLGSVGFQRKAKLAEEKREHLQNEFADVLITLFLVAKALDVDIMDALDAKIATIKAKHNKQL